MSEPAVLQADGMRFAVGDPPREREVSFTLRASNAIVIEGPSGCGKSTLLRALCRLEPITGGELLLDGERLGAVLARGWRRRLSYLAQRPVMLPGTVRDNLAAPVTVGGQGPPVDDARAAAMLGRLGLEAPMLERDAAVLSGGEAARVALARALLQRPGALLCDEVTAALDDAHAATLVTTIGRYLEGGGALVLVAHDPARWQAVLGEGPAARVSLAGDER